MKYTLNRWQTLSLFLPIILIICASNLKLTSYLNKDGIAALRVVGCFNLLAIAVYHTYLAVNFLKATKSQSYLLYINAFVSPLFFGFVFSVAFYKAFIKHLLFETDRYMQPIAPGMGFLGWSLFALLLHSILNFFFITNKVVTTKIAEQPHGEKQRLLSDKFEKPLTLLRATAIGSIATAMSISLINKIIQAL